MSWVFISCDWMTTQSSELLDSLNHVVVEVIACSTAQLRRPYKAEGYFLPQTCAQTTWFNILVKVYLSLFGHQYDSRSLIEWFSAPLCWVPAAAARASAASMRTRQKREVFSTTDLNVLTTPIVTGCISTSPRIAASYSIGHTAQMGAQGNAG